MSLLDLFTSPTRKRMKSPKEGASNLKAKVQSTQAVRRELIAVAWRDTMLRHGIPASWIGTDMRTLINSRGEPLFDLKLQLRRWEPMLLKYSTALQLSFMKRITMLDPSAISWVRDISWQFELPVEGAPSEMPPPDYWKPAPPKPSAEAPAEEAAPVLRDQLAELRKAMAEGDARMARAVNSDFEATQPFNEEKAASAS